MVNMEKLEVQVDNQRKKCKRENDKLKKLEKTLQDAKTQIYLDVIEEQGGMTVDKLRDALREYKELHTEDEVSQDETKEDA